MGHYRNVGALLCIIAILIVIGVPLFRGTRDWGPPPTDRKELVRWAHQLEHSRDAMYRWFCVASALGGAGLALIIVGCGRQSRQA